MASGGGGCSASERLPPPFPGMDPESEGAAGGSEPEAGDSDTEGEDIFTGASKPQSPKKTTSLFLIKNGSKENGIHEEQDQEPQDLFADATVELSLDSTQNNQKTMQAKTLISHPPQEATNSSKPQPSSEELEEEEQEDQFDLTVGITDPEKIGDGMNAYVAYKVTTQTSLPMFRSKQFAVKRRFSDFLGLYEKLSEKHSQNGFIVPPPPEKSLIGMTKVKVGKEDSSSAEFLEKRRAALERYLQRVVNHPTMLQDPDVREFLEKEELPRAVGTQALSGAGLLKMFNKATDAVSKMTIKMNESDIWFEEKLQEVECEEQRLRKLHTVVETLVTHRKELALNTAQFAKSLAMLGSSEDNTALSRALSQLAEVEEKIEQIHQEQANNDFFLLAELLSDYIRLLAIVRAPLIIEGGQCALCLSSSKAYCRPAGLAPWSSDFFSPLVFASLTVSAGFALIRALADFHLSLQRGQSGNDTDLAWRCMEECDQDAERACHQSPPCALLTTLVATLQATPHVKHLTSFGDQGCLFLELSDQLRKFDWAVLALAWPP